MEPAESKNFEYSAKKINPQKEMEKRRMEGGKEQIKASSVGLLIIIIRLG